MAGKKSVGILLADEAERSLVSAAVRDCGLEPVVLANSPAGSFSPAELPAERTSRDRPSTGEEDWQPGLIVTDRPLPPPAAGAGSLPLVIPICDSLAPEATGAEAQSWRAEHPWVLCRPLQSEVVRAQLEQASRARRLFARRSRRQAEELHRTRSILDSMSNGVSLSDATQPDMPLVYVNPAFERMTGYSAVEVCGRNCRFLQGPDNDQPGVEEVREAIRERRDLRVLLKNYRKDGTPFWNELYMSPVWSTSGELTHFVGFQNDVTARVESVEQIQHLAHHDALTGLANRAYLMERLEQALLKAERNGVSVAVLFFDLDRFKYVNDLFGHEAGDRLLQTVAERLLACTRKDEVVARIGGDEFVVVLEGIRDELQAVEVLRRLQHRLTQVYDLCGEPFHPSASIGMTLFPRDGESPSSLLKAADGRMYLAKQQSHLNDDRRELSAAPAH